MISVSTHILDTSSGVPASGVGVALIRSDTEEVVGSAATDADGRIGTLGAGLDPGGYRLRFDTEGYGGGFFPHIEVAVRLDGDREHYHIPLLLSPYGYTTYRGS